jgi:hypothetical protein
MLHEAPDYLVGIMRCLCICEKVGVPFREARKYALRDKEVHQGWMCERVITVGIPEHEGAGCREFGEGSLEFPWYLFSVERRYSSVP